MVWFTLVFAHIYNHSHISLGPLLSNGRGCANIVERASMMGAELHLRDDHPVALEFKSLRKAVETFQVRLHIQFY
jgi:hypothetical protein